MNATRFQKTLDVLIALLLEFSSPILALAVPFVVWFHGPRVRTDSISPDPTSESTSNSYVDRAALEGWLSIWQTPDEYLPGALYEPTVRKVLAIFGWHVCSIYWLLRNQMYGLAWRFGMESRDYLDAKPGLVERGRLWRWWYRVGPFVLQAGWKVHRRDFDADAHAGPFWAIRFVTIRLRRNS